MPSEPIRLLWHRDRHRGAPHAIVPAWAMAVVQPGPGTAIPGQCPPGAAARLPPAAAGGTCCRRRAGEQWGRGLVADARMVHRKSDPSSLSAPPPPVTSNLWDAEPHSLGTESSAGGEWTNRADP